MTYGPKIHYEQGQTGGDKLTIESGGEVDVKAGGKILAAGTQAANIVALTDNSGGTADNTIAAVGIAATLTDNTGLSGSHDDTLAASAVPADIAGGESPTEAEHNAALAVMRVMAQNDSDLCQKVIEVVADLTDVKNNFADLTAKVNALIAAVQGAGITAAS